MKKVLFSTLAASTLLLAASCSQDDELVAAFGPGEQSVTLKVQLPGSAETRAIAEGVEVGKGNMANTLVYALYEKGKEDQTPLILGQKEEDTDGVFVITVPMAKDLTYELLLLAYNEDNCAFDVNYKADDLASVDLQNLTLKSSLSANQEAYDAFVGHETVSVNAEAVTVISLKRPFAQVNAATTDTDLADAETLKAVVTSSQLVINDVPTVYNVFTGEATELMDLTYTDAAILYQTNTTNNEKITVDGTEYNHLTLAYVLAGETATSDKSTHDATFTFNREDGTTVSTISVANLPIQRNYRTNVVGGLLTKTEAYQVKIDPIFDEPDENIDNIVKVSSAEDLQKAINEAEAGDTYIEFTQDIDATEFAITGAIGSTGIIVTQNEGVNLVIGGSGYKFNGTFYLFGQARYNGAETLTFRNIKFEHTGDDAIDFISCNETSGTERYAHNVTVENCSFTGNGNGQVVGMRYRQCYNMSVVNTTATGMHSLMQSTGGNGITLDKVTVSDSKNGISFGTTLNLKVENSDITAEAYGIRVDGTGELTINNTVITAEIPVIARKVTEEKNYAVKLDNVELNTNTNYHVVFTNGSDDEAYVAPGGTYTITGADNYVVFPREQVLTVTSGNLATTNFNINNATYKFEGHFCGQQIIKTTSSDILNQVYDGSAATFDGHVRFTVKRIADNKSELTKERSGNYTFKGFKTDNSIAFGACGVEALNIVECEAYMMYLNVSNSEVTATGNTIVRPASAGDSYLRYDDGTQTDIIQVYAENYTLNLYGNTIRDEKGVGNNIEVYGQNEWQSDATYTNSINVKGNIISNVGEDKPLVKIYNDVTYAPVAWPADYEIQDAAIELADQLLGENTLETYKDCLVSVLCRTSSGKDDTNIGLYGNGCWMIGNEMILNSASALRWFADQVNVSNNSFSGKTVKLGADIDLENAAWTPVGQTGATQFKGTFDGQDYTISNLNIDATAQTGGNYSSGLFGWLNGATVKNVKVAGASVKGNHNVAVIAGYLETTGCTVENCHVSGATVECHVASSDANGDKCGVIVGHAGNNGVAVKNCTATNSTVSAGRDAGQIVGAALEANVTGCSATNVTVTANGEGTGANIRNEVIGRLLQ